MLDEDKNFGGSLVLDLRIWWRHVKTHHNNDYFNDYQTFTLSCNWAPDLT